ncbi:alpha/beta fold hydrolase [Streptomyces sp. NPDC047017]|uniref:thioesterase II family protein n=1 Tax=Streptomyces sp. NPDC047017 TaxID=3155024 RepID=UPI0033C09958
MSDASAWMKVFAPAPSPRAQVVCFPHAGGAASSYAPLARLLSPEVRVVAVQYPGRQDRNAEPCVDDIATLADRLSGVLRQQLGLPTAFFGHSMGATVAFETVRRLEKDPGWSPVRLFVSGRRAPGIVRDEDTYVHLRDDEGLIADVVKLGGTDPVVFADPELRALVLPPIRADYRAVETYRCPPDATVTCPMAVLVGDADPRVSVAEARQWEKHTTGEFGLQVFGGGHFYLDAERPAVAHAIRDGLRAHL